MGTAPRYALAPVPCLECDRAMAAAPRTLFVTSALPYASGDIHFGHLLEHIQTDIWVRFQKLKGHRVIYCCADDSHGTPMMLTAERLEEPAEALVERYRAAHAGTSRPFTSTTTSTTPPTATRTANAPS